MRLNRPTEAARPHVLFLVNQLFSGGAEHHLVELVRRGLASGSFSAHVVCLKSAGDSERRARRGDLTLELCQSGVPVEEGWLRHKYDVAVVRRLLQSLGRTRPDIIYTHTGLNELLLARVAAARGAARTVCVVHSTKNSSGGERFGLAYRLLLRRTSAVVGLAPSHRRYLVLNEGLDPARTVTIPHGVDETRFRPRSGPRVDLDRSLAGRRVLGLVGSTLRDKGHHVLLDALPRVLQQHSDVAVAFVGSETTDTPHFEADLRARAASMGIADRVRFLGHRFDVVRVLHGLDVFVLPSLRETFSIAVLEAMACGLPIVTTRVGSLPDMLTDGQEGFLVEPNDPMALADRLNVVLSDPARAHGLAAAARRRVEREFTLDRMVNEYSALFGSLALPR